MTDRPEWDARRSAWEADRLGPAAARAPERRTRFSTISDMEVERLYGPWSWREGAGGPTEVDHHGDPLRAAAAPGRWDAFDPARDIVRRSEDAACSCGTLERRAHVRGGRE